MDLTYPPEAEEFRKEIRAWLEEHLPEGWFDDGFEMTAEEKKQFNEEWPNKLYDGGWICATWPQEYGGKGLSDDGERRAEPRSSPGPRRRCGPTSSATRSSARRSCSGAPRSRRRSSCPKILTGEMSLVPGLQRAELRLRPRRR